MNINKEHKSPYFSDRITMIVLRHTVSNIDRALGLFSGEIEGSLGSPHYVVGKNGEIFQLVDENNKA